jgi:hypothetical protein
LWVHLIVQRRQMSRPIRLVSSRTVSASPYCSPARFVPNAALSKEQSYIRRGDLDVSGDFEDLHGLPSLTSVGGRLEIVNSDFLTDLSGL